MPSIQEVVNRNANRGVTYYSPTRPVIRPQGRTANAGTAARILQQRQPTQFAGQQPQYNMGQATPLPAYRPPDQPGNGRTRLDDILEGLDGPPQPQQAEEPGGWRGVLGTVANSVPGRIIFGALDVLDRPRRAVAATIAEGLDLVNLNAESRSDGDASFSDWWSEFNDPTFGFGDIVASTGNKWLDRGIGLAGDLATDPLNYLTGSGVIAGTGARARVNLAARVFGAGIPEEIANRSGRLGLQALSNTERRAINAATDVGERLLDRGYYAKLPFLDGRVRIPGSGPVEQLIGGATARARNAITSTRPLSTMRYWRSERGLQDAIGKLLTGRGDISFGVAAALVNYRKGAGIASSRSVGRLSAEWNNLVKRYGQSGLQDMVHEAETTGGTALNRFYEMAADIMEQEGLQRPTFANYIPHVLTPEAVEWLKTPEGKKFHNELFKEIDFDDLSPHMLQRKLIPRDRAYVLNGVRMEIKEGTIREINEQFAKAGMGFKLLDDDIANISARYTKSMAGSIGEAGGLLYLANQARGLVRYADDDSVLKEVVDAAATKKLNVDAHQTVKQKLSAAEQLTATLKKQRDEGVTALHGPVAAHLRQLVETMDSLEGPARQELKDLLAAQAVLSGRRDALASAPLEYTENAAKLSAAADAAFDQIDQQYQDATARLAAIEPAFKMAEQQWLDAHRAAREAQAAGTSGVVVPKMSAVQKEFRKGVVELTQLTMDRDAAAQISQRVKAALAKERIIERNIDSDTFLARAAADMGIGRIDVKPPVKYIDPETGQVQWIDEGVPVDAIPEGVELRRGTTEEVVTRRWTPGGVEEVRRTKEAAERARTREMLDPRVSRGRTPEAIYREHNARRAAAIADHEANFPILRQYQDRIEAQTPVVLAAREDLFNAASVNARKTKAAQLHLNELRQQEREILNEIEELIGKPKRSARLRQLEGQLAELRGAEYVNVNLNVDAASVVSQPVAGQGPLGRALAAYVEAQRPMTEARQLYDNELAKLDNLKQLQNQEAARIRFTARDMAEERVHGAGLRNITAMQDVNRAQQNVRRAQAAVAAGQAKLEQLSADLEAARTAAKRQKVPVKNLRYVETAGETAGGNARYAPQTPEMVQRDAIQHLEAQVGAVQRTNRLAAESLAEAEAEVVASTERAGVMAAELADARAQRTSMQSESYFAEQLDNLFERNRDVNQRLRDQVQGQRQFRESAKGRAEQRLHGQRHTLNRDIADSDRRLAYWKDERESGPWQPVKIVPRDDGTYAVEPHWVGFIGGGEREIVEELAVKRNWAIEHWVDPTVNELDTVAADLARARERLATATNKGHVTRLNNQIRKLEARHQRLTDRLARFRRNIFERYEKQIITKGYGRADVGVNEAYSAAGLAERARRIAELEDLVRSRNELVIARDKINDELKRSGNLIDEYAKNVSRLRDERDAIQKEIANTVKEQTMDVVPERAQTLYGRRLRPVQESERNAMSTAAEQAYGYKIHWEPVPEVPADFGRVGVWSSTERSNLSIAYGVVDAWDKTPKNLRTAEMKAQRDNAVRYIRELTDPNVQRGGMTQFEHHLRTVIEATDDDGLTAALHELQRSRVPFRRPTQRSKLGRALRKGSGQGDRSPEGIANRSLKMFKEINANYGEKFVERGVFSAGLMAYFQHKAVQLEDVMNAFIDSASNKSGASPILLSRRDQLASDLNRFSEVMFTVRAAMEDAGAEPTNSLIAFIVAERLDKEADTIAENLDRTLAALGDKDLARADAALEYTRSKLDGEVSRLHTEWSQLNEHLSEVRTTRPLTDTEEKQLRNARAKYNKKRKELESMPDAPVASALSDEVHHIAYLADQYIEDVSTTFSDLKNARSIIAHQASPVVKARRIDALIEKATEEVTRAHDEIANMRLLIQQAREAGEDSITYVPWHRVQGYAMTPQEVLDTIAAKTRIEITQQQESRLGPRARKAIAEGNEDLITWERTFGGNEEPVTLSLYDAENLVHTNEAALVSRDWALEGRHAERAAVRGEATEWINHFGRVIQDQTRPPDVSILRGQLRDLEWEIGRRFPPTQSERETLQIQLMKDRIALASGPKMTEGELDALRRKQQLYIDTDASIRSAAGGEAAFLSMQAAQDDGRQLFTDVVSGARPVTDDEINVLVDLFGNAEEAEMSVLWLNTFNQLIDVVKQRRLTQQQLENWPQVQRHLDIAAQVPTAIEIDMQEARMILRQLQETVGDSRLNDSFANMIAESVERTGFDPTAQELALDVAAQEAQAAQKTAAGLKAYTAGERITGEEAQSEARQLRFSVSNIRNEIIGSLVESAFQAKNAAMADAQRTFRLLGFDNYIQSQRKLGVETMIGEQATARGAVSHGERFSLMGYSISKETYTDKGKLYQFINDMLHGEDFDYSHSLRRNARNLTARLQRVNTMRRSLGVALDEAAESATDPDRFLGLLAKWRTPNAGEPELGADVLDRITDFNTNVAQPSMNQVYSDRIALLNQQFAEAVVTNDMDAVERIGAQIRELRDGNIESTGLATAEAIPTGTEGAAAQVAAEGLAAPAPSDELIQAQSLVEAAQRDVDNSQQALAAAEAQMGEGGPVSVPNENAPTDARTLDDFMLDDAYQMAPSGKMTMAQSRMRSRALIEERGTLPRRSADRTVEQQARYKEIQHELSNLSKAKWAAEPEWQTDVTEAIAELERTGKPLPWDTATGEVANQETLARLRAEAEGAQARLTQQQQELENLRRAAAEKEQMTTGPEAGAQIDTVGDENTRELTDPIETQGVPASVPDTPDSPTGAPVPALDERFAEITDEFKQLMETHGPYENMPDDVKQRLAALASSARKIVDERRNMRAASTDARARVLREVPELAAYLERAKQLPAALPPTVASDWEQILRNGPTVRTFDPAIEKRLKPKVKLQTGVNKNDPAASMLGEVFPRDRTTRLDALRGNVALTPEGQRILQEADGVITPDLEELLRPHIIRQLGATTEASLRQQLQDSPRRIVQTARERLVQRLSEIKAERLQLERESVQATVDTMMENARRINLADAPELGPPLPELTPDELDALARGELDRITPEWRAAFEEKARLESQLLDAKTARALDAKIEAEKLAREERTRKLAEMDMDLAKVRTDVEAAETSVADYKELRNKIKTALDAVGADMKTDSPAVRDLLDLSTDIGKLASLSPGEANVITTLLNNAVFAQRGLDGAQRYEDTVHAQLKAFGKNPKKAKVAGEVMKKVALDGWEGIGTKLLRDEDSVLSAAGEAAGLRANQSVYIAKDLRDRLERVQKLMETPEAWKLVDKYTAFFKTYATGRPGFHVRNALSAIFMNAVDGVRIRDMYAGMSAWHAFTKNPREVWENADQKMRDALTAVMASGAGGQFEERGLASAGGAASRTYRALMNNKYTRFNQRAGTLVEGSVRMGMALNSVHRGQALDAMVDRITKYHFNYRELSSLDVTARRYIPFWTFMSRNLPLQLEQMWLRPQMYLRYQSFVRNFSEQPDPDTPLYWLMQGAFTMDEDAEGAEAPWYLAPDLPHLRVAEPFEAMMEGDWGKAVLSDVNPLIMAPAEAFAFGKKMYTGAPLEETYSAPSNVMKPLLPILALLGGTEQGASGQTVVDDRYAHVARSLLPPLEILERLTTSEGTRAGRQGETWLRTFGAPVYKLTDEMRASTRRQARAQRSEHRSTQAELARL